MKKQYETILLCVLQFGEDVVRCSGDFNYGVGDGVASDIFD